MTIELEHPIEGGDGALVNRGTINSGFALYVANGRLHFDYNAFHDHCLLSAEVPLSPGRHCLVVNVVRGSDREGDLSLCVDGAVVAKGRITRLIGMLSSTGMDIGRAHAPVNRTYTPPFVYPGRIDKVVFEIEVYQLPAPLFEAPEGFTRAVLFAHKNLSEMEAGDPPGK